MRPGSVGAPATASSRGVVPIEEARTLDWARLRHLELVVEVLSPTTARADRFTKRRLYQEERIPTYWIVDPDARFVEVWTPDAVTPQVERERVVWLPGARLIRSSLRWRSCFGRCSPRGTAPRSAAR